MYQDFMRILRTAGLDEKIIEARNAMMESGLDIAGMFNEKGTFLGTTKNNRVDYLKRGRFYLARQGSGGWSIFYVNPINWLDEEVVGEGLTVGLIYIGWDGIKSLIDNPHQNPININTKGWNNPFSDIDAIEDYQGTFDLIGFKLNNIELGDSDYFRNDGFVFYELPQLKKQLGVFNWWW